MANVLKKSHQQLELVELIIIFFNILVQLLFSGFETNRKLSHLEIGAICHILFFSRLRIVLSTGSFGPATHTALSASHQAVAPEMIFIAARSATGQKRPLVVLGIDNHTCCVI